MQYSTLGRIGVDFQNRARLTLTPVSAKHGPRALWLARNKATLLGLQAFQPGSHCTWLLADETPRPSGAPRRPRGDAGIR